jgi:hypothetical protein
MRHIIATAILLSLGASAFAHRLDEYLQATIISVEKDHLQASMRLIPGVAVSSAVIASIDSNGDGVFSEAEQPAYAERVLRDLSLTVDGKSASPMLVSQKFPAIEEIREGLGEIQIEFTVELALGGPERKIVLENHHQNRISAYLVNCLVPHDPNIRILAQKRKPIVLSTGLRAGRSSSRSVNSEMVDTRSQLDGCDWFCEFVPTRHAAHRRGYGSSFILTGATSASAFNCRRVALGRIRRRGPQSASDSQDCAGIYPRTLDHVGPSGIRSCPRAQSSD